jgi:hypothetical protein
VHEVAVQPYGDDAAGQPEADLASAAGNQHAALDGKATEPLLSRARSDRSRLPPGFRLAGRACRAYQREAAWYLAFARAHDAGTVTPKLSRLLNLGDAAVNTGSYLMALATGEGSYPSTTSRVSPRGAERGLAGQVRALRSG